MRNFGAAKQTSPGTENHVIEESANRLTLSKYYSTDTIKLFY